MKTPICDFVNSYVKKQPVRFHMPGHSGKPLLGSEPYDLTEIDGADDLFHASGVILESEKNAGEIFGCDTYYSTEGSSLCIRAMAYLASKRAPAGEKPLFVAGRNAHRSFISAAALLDIDVKWIAPQSYLTCKIDAKTAERAILQCPRTPDALFITSPDYMGNITDVSGIAEICRKHGVLLLVHNAHGAYLKFYNEKLYPMNAGADLCCDSAHKTLPVITGGAYLHSNGVFSRGEIKSAMSLFATSSPSYLILQSLDFANALLVNGFKENLQKAAAAAKKLKASLENHGYEITGDEPLKIVLSPKSFGYTGDGLADAVRRRGIEAEFSDPDHTVFLPSSAMSSEEFSALENALLSIQRKSPLLTRPPEYKAAEKAAGIREAVMSPSVILPADSCAGRVLSGMNVKCPPAVCPVIPGERIDENVIKTLGYYGIGECEVIRSPR